MSLLQLLRRAKARREGRQPADIPGARAPETTPRADHAQQTRAEMDQRHERNEIDERSHAPPPSAPPVQSDERNERDERSPPPPPRFKRPEILRDGSALFPWHARPPQDMDQDEREAFDERMAICTAWGKLTLAEATDIAARQIMRTRALCSSNSFNSYQQSQDVRP
jgi:hypothetical protein